LDHFPEFIETKGIRAEINTTVEERKEGKIKIKKTGCLRWK